MTSEEIAFNVRIEEQPTGGFSVVMVFEPHKTKDEAIAEAKAIAHNLQQLGWECGRMQ